MPDVKKLILVDDHPIVRQGLKQIIEQESDYRVAHEAEDAMGALNMIRLNRPDIAVIDISLKNISGIELIKWVAKLDFPVAVLVVSMHDEAIYAERALRAGAMGYVMKQEASDTIIKALRQIEKGKTFISASVAERMSDNLPGRGGKKGTACLNRLSDRELEVFQLLGQGLKAKQIAGKLLLSPKTIETHQANIKTKLNLAGSAELTRAAIEWMKEL